VKLRDNSTLTNSDPDYLDFASAAPPVRRSRARELV
jgi:hypothetical protein